jgi:hypothetical protein
MTALHGKGIWVLYSANLDLALKAAVKIGATHMLCKTGHQATFLTEAAHWSHGRVRTARLTPFAWHSICCEDPAEEARVILKTAEVGYDGIVFDVGERATGQQANAKELGRRLLDSGVNPQTLYYSCFPNISHYSSIPYAEMSAFCKGGFMPKSYPSLLKPAEVVIHKLTYEEHAKWSKVWARSRPVYPILATYRDQLGQDPLSPDELSHWVDVLAKHKPTFFSIYRAALTSQDLWPILAKMPSALPQEPAPPKPVVPPEPVRLDVPMEVPTPITTPEAEEQEVYLTVQPDDVVWRLCQTNGCTRTQFWEWNGHLWDDRGMPRDPDYMQAGWRVRVR